MINAASILFGFVFLISLVSTNEGLAQDPMDQARDFVRQTEEMSKIAAENLLREDIQKLFESGDILAGAIPSVVGRMKLVEETMQSFSQRIEQLVDSTESRILQSQNFDPVRLDQNLLESLREAATQLNRDILAVRRDRTRLVSQNIGGLEAAETVKERMKATLVQLSDKCTLGTAFDIYAGEGLGAAKGRAYAEMRKGKDGLEKRLIEQGATQYLATSVIGVPALPIVYTFNQDKMIEHSRKISDAYKYIFANQANYETAKADYRESCANFTEYMNTLRIAVEEGRGASIEAWLMDNSALGDKYNRASEAYLAFDAVYHELYREDLAVKSQQACDAAQSRALGEEEKRFVCEAARTKVATTFDFQDYYLEAQQTPEGRAYSELMENLPLKDLAGIGFFLIATNTLQAEQNSNVLLNQDLSIDETGLALASLNLNRFHSHIRRFEEDIQLGAEEAARVRQILGAQEALAQIYLRVNEMQADYIFDLMTGRPLEGYELQAIDLFAEIVELYDGDKASLQVVYDRLVVFSGGWLGVPEWVLTGQDPS